MVPFVRALKSHFAAGASLDKKTRALQSAPQHDQPPKGVLGVVSALPLPKFKTLLTVGAIAAGVYALKNSDYSSTMQRQFDRAS
jgi:hypothetical protein